MTSNFQSNAANFTSFTTAVLTECNENMDLEGLMQSLSLHVPDEHTARNFNVFAVKIGENHTDIVFGEFTNKYMIIATQYGRIGSLLKVSVDQVANGIDISEPVYSINVVFGSDNDEQQAAARFIAEKLNIRKPLLLFLCLKDYEVATVRSLVDALLNAPSSSSKEEEEKAK